MVQKLAVLAGVAVFAATMVLFRAYAPISLGLGVFAYLAVLAALWPRRRGLKVGPLPQGVDRQDFELAMERLAIGAQRLRTFVHQAPPSDGPLFERMAGLLDLIREHHAANPGHVTLTRTFIRHTLKRMLDSVSDYIDLAGRSGPDQQERLAEISRGFEEYVPVLEKIDKACLDNDLTALEINVEVLNEQLDRKQR